MYFSLDQVLACVLAKNKKAKCCCKKELVSVILSKAFVLRSFIVELSSCWLGL